MVRQLLYYCPLAFFIISTCIERFAGRVSPTKVYGYLPNG